MPPVATTGPGGPGNVPPPFQGKNISSSERGRELNQRAAAKREARKVANGGVDPLLLAKKLNNRLTRRALDADYVSKAFDPPWDEHYRQRAARLKRQYAPRGTPAVQYEILVHRLAALDTFINQFETSPGRKDRYLILGHYDRLTSLVAQLQKYTEAEKRELVVEERVTVELITTVIGIADSTITDAIQRANFLRAVRLQLGDESARLELPDVALPILDVIPRAAVVVAQTTGQNDVDLPPGVSPASNPSPVDDVDDDEG